MGLQLTIGTTYTKSAVATLLVSRVRIFRRQYLENSTMPHSGQNRYDAIFALSKVIIDKK